MKPLQSFAGIAYFLLRVVAGLLFACHGAQKLLGAFGGQQPPMGSLLWFAGVIELVGGVMIGAGLYTGAVAFLASGEMAVAYFQAHLPRGFWPVTNGGELAALYCFVFLYFAAMGSGKWSIDSIRK
jgi:putative oxidoreductase